uniref:Uncharacterized protein n=1 Tax=Spironucleus salmonicida TaxID=348837 RepID=V6LWN7_9EUKA|eukprot:EST49057.1 Hypothetical protein SS50377_10680 [Spironucleus salmonicida]
MGSSTSCGAPSSTAWSTCSSVCLASSFWSSQCMLGTASASPLLSTSSSSGASETSSISMICTPTLPSKNSRLTTCTSLSAQMRPLPTPHTALTRLTFSTASISPVSLKCIIMFHTKVFNLNVNIDFIINQRIQQDKYIIIFYLDIIVDLSLVNDALIKQKMSE